MHWQTLILLSAIATLGLWTVVSDQKSNAANHSTETEIAAFDISLSSHNPAITLYPLHQAEYEALIEDLEYAALSYQLKDDPSRAIRVRDIGFSETELESYALSPSTPILAINNHIPAKLFSNFRNGYLTRGLLKLKLESDTGPVTVAWQLATGEMSAQ